MKAGGLLPLEPLEMRGDRMTDWERLVGKRVLLRTAWEWPWASEAVVEEVSPSGKYVKFRRPGGSAEWVDATRYELVEVLDSWDEPNSANWSP